MDELPRGTKVVDPTRPVPNFDAVAKPYRWAEYLCLGPLLERMRNHYLPQITGAGHALALGDGDGRFLAVLLRRSSTMEAVAVDTSAAMLASLRGRCAFAGLRLHVLQGDFASLPGHLDLSKTDLVITHFSLDCLPQDEVETLAQTLAGTIRPGALWVVSDFGTPARQPWRGAAGLYVRGLYLAFRLLTGLRVQTLPDVQHALRIHGFCLLSRSHRLKGLLYSELWQLGEVETGREPPISRNFTHIGLIHPSVSTKANEIHLHPATAQTDPSQTEPVPSAKPERLGPKSDLVPKGTPASKTAPSAKGTAAPALTYLPHPSREGLNVFLMRHASAGTRRVNPKLDVKRPLDKDGKRHCLQLAQVLGTLRVNFDLIVSSPLKRCLQTAQLVGTEMGYEARILHAQALEPGADFAQFQRLLHECRSYDNVLMVGHNPNMTAFLGQLIAHSHPQESTARENTPKENGQAIAEVRLRKGAIARVTVERGPAVLKWLLDPRLVRALYATSTKSSRRKISRK